MAESRPLVSDFYKKNALHLLYPLLELGDALEFKRSRGYSHWAVYVGSEVQGGKIQYLIIHRSVPPDMDPSILANDNILAELVLNKALGSIVVAPLESAVEDDLVRINNSMNQVCQPFPAEQIVARAVEAMSNADILRPYNLLSNNCEHFVNECRYGKRFSQQVVDGCVDAFMQFCDRDQNREDVVTPAQVAGEMLKLVIPRVFMGKPPE